DDDDEDALHSREHTVLLRNLDWFRAVCRLPERAFSQPLGWRLVSQVMRPATRPARTCGCRVKNPRNCEPGELREADQPRWVGGFRVLGAEPWTSSPRLRRRGGRSSTVSAGEPQPSAMRT